MRASRDAAMVRTSAMASVPIISSISPKYSPGSKVVICCIRPPKRFTISASPESNTHKCGASPSRAIHSPAASWMSAARDASRARNSLEIALHKGTQARSSGRIITSLYARAEMRRERRSFVDRSSTDRAWPAAYHRSMNGMTRPLIATAAALFLAVGAASVAQPQQQASPIFGVTIPAGYRNWEFVASSQETGDLDELRAVVGNALSMAAYRNGTLPFPDGAVLVKLAYKRVQSSEFPAAFVPGSPTTVQVMVKDSKRYASTGGWGFGRFINSVPVDEAQHRTCFACHAAHVKDHDFVFTRYAE